MSMITEDVPMNSGLKTLIRIAFLMVAIVALVLVTACTPGTSEVTGKFALPEGLQDCKFYEMTSGVGGFTVVRCPNSSTTTHRGGKGAWTTMTIDGVQYEMRKKEATE
jgi:hypothetical protein